jgi:hypothetical protein
MRRLELQHIILEVGRRFGLKDVFIIGSAALLASVPEPPEGILTTSRDVDIVPLIDPDERVADQISFVLGEASDFDEAYGYHAQGVSFKTPTYAPQGWQGRTIAVHVDEYVGHCMEPHDLILSKLGAGREKDLEFARAATELKILSPAILKERLKLVDTSEEHAGLIARRIEGIFR